MKLTLRVLAVGLLGLGLSGLPGCSDSNDSDTVKDTNAGGQKAKVAADSPATPQEQYQQMQSKGSGTAKGYGPGNTSGGGGGGGRR
jgi:hypothetical protein